MCRATLWNRKKDKKGRIRKRIRKDILEPIRPKHSRSEQIHNTAKPDSFSERVEYVPAVDGNGLEKEIVAEREREPAQLHSLPEGGHQQRLQSDHSLLSRFFTIQVRIQRDPVKVGQMIRVGRVRVPMVPRFGSGLNPDSMSSVDPDPDPGGRKLLTKIELNRIAEGCSLDVLYGVQVNCNF